MMILGELITSEEMEQKSNSAWPRYFIECYACKKEIEIDRDRCTDFTVQGDGYKYFQQGYRHTCECGEEYIVTLPEVEDR